MAKKSLIFLAIAVLCPQMSGGCLRVFSVKIVTDSTMRGNSEEDGISVIDYGCGQCIDEKSLISQQNLLSS